MNSNLFKTTKKKMHGVSNVNEKNQPLVKNLFPESNRKSKFAFKTSAPFYGATIIYTFDVKFFYVSIEKILEMNLFSKRLLARYLALI